MTELPKSALQMSGENSESTLAQPSAEHMSTQESAVQPTPIRPTQQQLSFPNLAFGVQMTHASGNAEAELISKVTSDHISQELTNNHERELRNFTLHEKAIDAEAKEKEREHERDRRDRDQECASDARLERVFYVVLAAIALLVGVMIYKGQTESVKQWIQELSKVMLALLGGISVEKWRRDRADKYQMRKKGIAAKGEQDP